LGYTLAQPAVRAIQAQGVVANAKHWVVNSQETDRMIINEFVDERTRMEYYYPPFAGAIRAGVGSVMCSCALAASTTCALSTLPTLAGLLYPARTMLTTAPREMITHA
jgi:beta-glucosidase-like glycosyl hydrolase